MGAGAIDELLARVSYHAVTRYVQRVLRQAPIANDDAGTRACAIAHCDAAGTTIGAVRRAILTPPVATEVRTAAFVAEISHKNTDGHGVVTTIFLKPRQRASKILDRREARRTLRHIGRKAKGQPSKSIRSREVDPV